MSTLLRKLKSFLPSPSEPFPDVAAVRDDIAGFRVEALRSRQLAEQVLADAAATRAVSGELRAKIVETVDR
ncbi:MAG: hypothetical protein J0H57_05665 [Rhodospirillales bacterium]|nr:hypothetical protein [Rhodospirillales bacterium]